MKKADTVTAAGFLLFAAAMLLTALFHLPAIRAALVDGWAANAAEDSTLLDKAAWAAGEGESILTGELDPDHLFIQLYGGAQRLMGRRYVADLVPGNSVVRLDSGGLNFINLAWAQSGGLPALSPGQGGKTPDVSDNAGNAAALSRYLAEGDIPLLAVTAPMKIASDADLPMGLHDQGNAAGDALLGSLAAAGVDTFDLRPGFDGRADRAELFFRTDHHWKPEGAFYAWQLLADELGARYGFTVDPALADPASYDWRTIPGLFLGSQGKRVGSLYAGADDFTVATPRFDTSFTYRTPYETREGGFARSLCFPQFVEARDWFNGNPYVYYSGGDYGEAVMTNHQNPGGPRVLLIRDSFSCALAPFLATGCSELTTVDLRHLERPLADVIAEAEPDLVLLLYCTSTASNRDMFAFGV